MNKLTKTSQLLFPGTCCICGLRPEHIEETVDTEVNSPFDGRKYVCGSCIKELNKAQVPGTEHLPRRRSRTLQTETEEII